MLNDPIQLIGPASLIGNSRVTFHKSGTDGSNPVSLQRRVRLSPDFAFPGQKAAFRVGVKRCWTKPCRSLNSRPDVETSAPARRFKSVVDGLASQSLIVKESSTRDSHTFSIVTVLSAVPWEASKASAKLFRDRNVDRSHPWHVREFRSDHGKTDALIFRPRMRTGRARPRQFPCGASYL